MMLEVGSFKAASCAGLSRRAFLRAGASVPAALGLAPLASALAGEQAKAKSVLVVWLWGGPSHLDTFDPKPKAPQEYRGPFATIQTRIPGVQFSELLPGLAERSHLFSLVRTNVNFSGDHLIAGSIGLTGADEGPGGHPPNFGSIVARQRPAQRLPTFVSLANGAIGDGRGPMKGYGGGTFGQAYDPFMVSCSPEGKVEIPALRLIDGLSPGRLDDRALLLGELDRVRRQADRPSFAQWDEIHQRAHALLNSSEAQKAFDLSRESASTREAYGHTAFGQSCLLGRRLIEAGVPYVQVNWSRLVEVLFPFSDYGWDTHAENFELLADWHGPILDRAASALFTDLSERGLLESTLVVCLGEFGRTPRINEIASRDHWPQCYCSLWAGGGVVPGRVVGSSDKNGEFPVNDPVTPATVGATMLELSGISTAERAQLRVLEQGRVIHDLL
ncbi:MAG TPA: DUF1501 domain-containing protein [Planctomycetaceae bacterium]|nr:DUF1501 domain-containing protein [Planctomycetaceae bacterium]